MNTQTDTIDAVMQAAERLRKAMADPYGDWEPIYGRQPAYWGGCGHTEWYPSCVERDRRTLADFALSILPKGKRPVAALASEVPHDQRPHHWGHRWGKPHQANRLFWWGDEPLFASEDDCKTAMILDSLEKHQKLVSELEAPFAS